MHAMSYSIEVESRRSEGPPCRFCGRPVPPQDVRRGRPKVHCSEQCQKRAWNAAHPRVGQKVIDWTPEAEPQPITSEAQRTFQAKRTSRLFRREALLARLRMGPTPRHEMKAYGGDRFSARLEELRRSGHRVVGPVPAPKYGIFETTSPNNAGEDIYELKDSSEARHP